MFYFRNKYQHFHLFLKNDFYFIYKMKSKQITIIPNDIRTSEEEEKVQKEVELQPVHEKKVSKWIIFKHNKWIIFEAIPIIGMIPSIFRYINLRCFCDEDNDNLNNRIEALENVLTFGFSQTINFYGHILPDIISGKYEYKSPNGREIAARYGIR